VSEASAGLVPSINNVETLKVDHLRARCTRLRKNLGVGAKWLSKGAGQSWMLTFTYRDDAEWKGSHVRDALANLRKWLQRTHGWTLRYLWVMEVKARKSGERIGEERPHYHCVVWVPRGLAVRDLAMDARGWWPHGMTNAVEAVAPVRYVMKYVSKFDSPEAFPKGARCYGIGGLDVVGRSCRRWINWPAFVQARADVRTPVMRRPGGGWLVAGIAYASEWGVSAIGRGYTRLLRLCTHPPTGIAPVGPFSFLPESA
jgi:hypothetical protein